jgi:NTP pyrophosphatase (non-canonical NTP hydrolase)
MKGKTMTNLTGVDHAANQEYVHRVNVEHGWYDKPVSFLEAMALLMTEVVEVNDAYYDEGLSGGRKAGPQMASEFADCYIRLVDDASRFTVDLGVAVDVYKHSFEYGKSTSFDGRCMQLVRRIRDAIEEYREHGMGEGLYRAHLAQPLAFFYLQLQAMSDEFGIDLSSAFSLKMAVNEKREWRHGNLHA